MLPFLMPPLPIPPMGGGDSDVGGGVDPGIGGSADPTVPGGADNAWGDDGFVSESGESSTGDESEFLADEDSGGSSWGDIGSALGGLFGDDE
jgi:hypothetical protein